MRSEADNALILPATRQHRAALRALFELYAHDFSPLTGADVDEAGHFTSEDFLSDAWWDAQGEDFHPFLLRVNGHWAGFAWVMVGSYVAPGRARSWLMEEFFILRKYRRRGLGTWFACALFDRFPGPWEVGQLDDNHTARAFWRRVIGHYTGGRYQELRADNARWQGTVQRFVSRPSR
jgi:predicted acetyltransferase